MNNFWTKQRSSQYWYFRLGDLAAPAYTEISLYIIAVSFFASSFLSEELRNQDLILIFGIFSGLTLFDALSPKKLTFYRKAFAPILVLISTFVLAAAYFGTTSTDYFGGITALILGTYHLLMLGVFLFFFQSTKRKLLSMEQGTELVEICIATIITAIAFGLVYSFTSWSDISWAVPITLSLLTWEHFGSKLARVLKQ